jgi:hypothetical protein
MIEKRAACGSEPNAVDAAGQQRHANFVFEIAYLPAQRRLRRVQPPLGRDRNAALICDRDEITKMPEFHRHTSKA